MPNDLFISVEQLAERIGVSRNLLLAEIARGAVPGVIHCGRRLLLSWPLWQLRALGVETPEALGEFARGAGIRDLSGLVAFLNGGGR